MCGALRLARFNSAAARHNGATIKTLSRAFPFRPAAGLIASITLFLLWARGRRTSPRQLALRSAAVTAFSFLHDVQPVSISEL